MDGPLWQLQPSLTIVFYAFRLDKVRFGSDLHGSVMRSPFPVCVESAD